MAAPCCCQQLFILVVHSSLHRIVTPLVIWPYCRMPTSTSSRPFAPWGCVQAIALDDAMVIWIRPGVPCSWDYMWSNAFVCLLCILLSSCRVSPVKTCLANLLRHIFKFTTHDSHGHTGEVSNSVMRAATLIMQGRTSVGPASVDRHVRHGHGISAMR